MVAVADDKRAAHHTREQKAVHCAQMAHIFLIIMAFNSMMSPVLSMTAPACTRCIRISPGTVLSLRGGSSHDEQQIEIMKEDQNVPTYVVNTVHEETAEEKERRENFNKARSLWFAAEEGDLAMVGACTRPISFQGQVKKFHKVQLQCKSINVRRRIWLYVCAFVSACAFAKMRKMHVYETHVWFAS
jgi:hypothetical protein